MLIKLPTLAVAVLMALQLLQLGSALGHAAYRSTPLNYLLYGSILAGMWLSALLLRTMWQFRNSDALDPSVADDVLMDPLHPWTLMIFCVPMLLRASAGARPPPPPWPSIAAGVFWREGLAQ